MHKLLKKHNYEVSVSSYTDSPKEISATFPERKEKPFYPALFSFYSFESENSLYFNNRNIEPFFLDCPKYAIEPIILFDISMSCKTIGFNEKVVSFYFDEEKVTPTNFKQKTFNSLRLEGEEIRKKEYLYSILKKSKESFSKDLTTESVSHGVDNIYTEIKKIYGNQ